MALYTTPTHGTHDPLKDRTLDQLQEMVFAGDLAPGSKLPETRIAAQLGVSRATLREAMARLCEMGLLVYTPYKGMHVRTVGPEDLAEIYSFRITLEKMAFRLCWDKRNRMNLADLAMRNDDLKACIERGDAYGSIVREQHLHSWCYELSGHGLLLQTWMRLRVNMQFYFSLHQKAHGRIGPVKDAHDRYVELASGDDLDALFPYLEDHMQAGLEATMRSLQTENFADTDL